MRLRAINPKRPTESLQITVPAWLIRDLGWKHGDMAVFELADDSAVLRLATTTEVMGR